VYVFDVAIEADFVGSRFRSSQRGRLTWPARAEMASVSSVVYYDLADREAFFNGERWPTDVLVDGRSEHGNVVWSVMRGEQERIVLPIAEETSEFRSRLDALYRDQLGRNVAAPAIDPGAFVHWFRRYLRFRLHGCTHDVAAAKVWEQLASGGAPALCARPDAVSFPPEDESMDFRRQLEERLRDQPVVQPPTSVDALGEVVWTQRYLQARVRGCSHEAGMKAVEQQITSGEPGRCPA
jgi:hypothetical protein